MTADLRVMHVVLSLCPGGAERLVVDMSRRIHPLVPCSVCCLDERGAWADEVREVGIDVVQLLRRSGFRPSLALQIAAEADRQRARVLHCHQYSPFVYGALAGMIKPDLRIVFTEHGRLSDAPPSRKRWAANRVLGWRPNAIAAVSADLRGHMIAEGFSPARVRVIHNGIDPGAAPTANDRSLARRNLDVGDHTFVIGTVARLDPVKRLDLIIKAMDVVAPTVPEATLVLVGSGAEEPALRRLVSERGLSRSVLFTGMRHDARALLPAFDVYVNASASEGISLTVLEAMAASRPVIATRVGGNPEVVDDGVTGVLVPPGSEHAVGTAIVELHRDRARRDALGSAGRDRVIGHFSFDRMVREYLAIYRGA